MSAPSPALPSAQSNVPIPLIACRTAAMIAQSVRSASERTEPCKLIVSDDSCNDGSLENMHALPDGYAGLRRVRVRSLEGWRDLVYACVEANSVRQKFIKPCLLECG